MNTNPSHSIGERIEQLAQALDGLSVEIDFDPGAEVWHVEIDQGIGYKPRWIRESGRSCAGVLDVALTRAHV